MRLQLARHAANDAAYGCPALRKLAGDRLTRRDLRGWDLPVRPRLVLAWRPRTVRVVNDMAPGEPTNLHVPGYACAAEADHDNVSLVVARRTARPRTYHYSIPLNRSRSLVPPHLPPFRGPRESRRAVEAVACKAASMTPPLPACSG